MYCFATICSAKPENIVVVGYPIPLNLSAEMKYTDIISLFSSIIALSSVIIAVGAFLYSLWKDRQLKRKEYAERIRIAAGLVIAKIERWSELALGFFNEIQPTIVDAHTFRFAVAEEGASLNAARKTLYSGLVSKRAENLKKINEEQIEIAYSDLYGYDPKIQNLFDQTIKKLKYIDRRIYRSLILSTQDDIKNCDRNELGDVLRTTADMHSYECEYLMIDVTKTFSDKMMNLIIAKDNEIYNKSVDIDKKSNKDSNNSDRDHLLSLEFALKGLNFRSLKHYDKALRCYKKAIKKAPEVEGFWAGKGLTLKAKNKDGFKDDFSKANTYFNKNH